MNSIAINTIACIVACTALSASAQQNAKMEYPVTKKTDHVDLYFGTKVADPYRWLENDTAADVAEWVKAQNQFTDQFLSKIPYRDALKKRITDLVNYPKYGIPEIAGNYYIYSKNDGLQNQAVFYYRKKDGSLPSEGAD